MTVVRLTKQTQETPRHESKTHFTRAKKQAAKISRTLRKELVFGFVIAAIILGVTAISAFNGGVSLETGNFHLTLNASLADGLRLSFVSLQPVSP